MDSSRVLRFRVLSSGFLEFEAQGLPKITVGLL